MMGMRSRLAVAACTAAVAGVGVSAALAGEITGNGKPTAGPTHANSICVFSGQNDDPTEKFTLADAQLLLTFAQQHHMARLSFWAINRDFGCAAGTLSGTCSGISQSNYAFSNIFRQFTG